MDSVVQCVHACWNRSVYMAWWTNRLEQHQIKSTLLEPSTTLLNQHKDKKQYKSTALFIHGRTCCQENDEITRLNSDGIQQVQPWTSLLYQVGFCMYIANKPLSIHQAVTILYVETWLNNIYIYLLLFYQINCSIMLMQCRYRVVGPTTL